jgi:protein-disulfide isomerase
MSKRHREDSRAERAAAALIAQERRERARRAWIVGGVVAAVLAIVAAGYLVQSTRDTSGRAATAPAGVTDTYGVVIGDASAAHTVTVYEDFQCPICHEFEQKTRDRLRRAVDAGKIRLDYRMVAFLDEASTTDYSTRALNAAAVVLDTAGPDVFLEFHDLLFDHQPPEGSAGLSDSQLVTYAVRAGADAAVVRPGIEGLTFRQWAVNATSQMSKDGVNGTPTVLVDGERQPEATLQSSIDTALAAID